MVSLATAGLEAADSLLWSVLLQIPRYILTLHELLAHTPHEHVERNSLDYAKSKLEELSRSDLPEPAPVAGTAGPGAALTPGWLGLVEGLGQATAPCAACQGGGERGWGRESPTHGVWRHVGPMVLGCPGCLYSTCGAKP